MAKLQIGELTSAIQEMGVSWEAGETEVSHHQETDIKGLFGLRISEPQRLSTMAAARQQSNALFAAALPPRPPPSEIDWRRVKRRNWVTDVRNQRTCGACVAFATCAVLESRSRISIDDESLDIDLSEAHLFFCGAGQACNLGWDFVSALKFCQATGVGEETQFPYAPSNQPCKSIPAIVEVQWWSTAVDEIARRQAIAEGPVIAGMKVYDDLQYYKKGIYQHVSGDFLGLHAVAVVGYNEPRQYWIVKNSWGSGWGEAGLMRIAFGECGLDTQFPFYNPTVVYRGT